MYGNIERLDLYQPIYFYTCFGIEFQLYKQKQSASRLGKTFPTGFAVTKTDDIPCMLSRVCNKYRKKKIIKIHVYK